MTRKRINITVDDDMYVRLQHIKSVYGFRNICEFNTALLNILCNYIDAKKDITTTDLHTDIESMFNELSEGTERTYGDIPVRHNNHGDSDNNNG